jgi:hypothetical protein
MRLASLRSKKLRTKSAGLPSKQKECGVYVCGVYKRVCIEGPGTNFTNFSKALSRLPVFPEKDSMCVCV